MFVLLPLVFVCVFVSSAIRGFDITTRATKSSVKINIFFMFFIFFLFFIFLSVLGNHVSELLHAFFNNFNFSLDTFYFNRKIKSLVQIPCAEAQEGRCDD